MNTIQIKSYFFPSNVKVALSSLPQVDEIRRFNLPVPSQATGIYRSLLEKLQLAYGKTILASSIDEIRTYWQDDENELISFGSDAEMSYAIDVQTAMKRSSGSPVMLSPALFKVYVSTRKPSPASFEQQQQCQDNDQTQVHYGVQCDGCEGSVVGVRFKCNICPDYDLCAKCHAKGTHRDTEHAMTKIDKPRRCPFSRSGAGPSRHHGHRSNASWRNSFAGSASHGNTASDAPPNPLQQALNDFLPHMSNSIPFVKDPEQLKAVGEYLRTFLDPFGIEVDYFVDKDTKKTAPKTDEKAKKEQEAKATTSTTATATATAEATFDTEFAGEEKATANKDSPVFIDVDVSMAATTSHKTTASAPSEGAAAATNVAAESEESLKPKAEAKAEDLSADKEDQGFNLVDMDKEIRIIKAIESLRAMGYSDDGGWLTRLAIAKNGSINAILDAISPFGAAKN